MGTNYYVKAVPAECPCCHRPFEKLHIGKVSSGWRFSFRAYPEQDLMSFAKWKARLAHSGTQIVDEYGNDVSFDDFVKVVTDHFAGELSAYDIKGEFVDPDGHPFYHYEFS